MITGRTTGGRTHRHRQPLHIWPLDQQYFVEVINERLRLSLFRGKDVRVKLWIICAVWTTNWTTVSQKKRFYQCLQMRRILFGRLFFCCNFVTIRNHICSLVTLRKISCSHRTIDGQWLWNHAIKSPEIGLRQGMLSLEPALFVYFLIKTLLQMFLFYFERLWYAETMPKTNVTGAGGYGTFQGHMSAHDLALNQGTQQQQQGYNSVPPTCLLIASLLFIYSWRVSQCC